MRVIINGILGVVFSAVVTLVFLHYFDDTYSKLEFKTVVRIESCADSGLCRVYFDDDSTDLLFYPYIGMKWIKDEK